MTIAAGRQMNTAVAASIISNDVVPASTDTRHRLIHGTSGPAPMKARVRATHIDGVRYRATDDPAAPVAPTMTEPNDNAAAGPPARSSIHPITTISRT